jgi:hypothetical protein
VDSVSEDVLIAQVGHAILYGDRTFIFSPTDKGAFGKLTQMTLLSQIMPKICGYQIFAGEAKY